MIYSTMRGLVACAGSAEQAIAFTDWICRGVSDNLSFGEGFVALVVTPEGEVQRYYGTSNYCVVDAPFRAEGSAYSFLLGAMAAGATAERGGTPSN